MQFRVMPAILGIARFPAIQRRMVRLSTPSWRPASSCVQPSAAMAAVKSAGDIAVVSNDAGVIHDERDASHFGADIVKRLVKCERVAKPSISHERCKPLGPVFASANKAHRIGGDAGGAAGWGFVAAHCLSPVDEVNLGPMVLMRQARFCGLDKKNNISAPSATLETPRAGADQKRMRCGAFPAKIHIVARSAAGNEGND